MKEALSYLSRLIILFVLYYVSGTAGVSINSVGGFATYVWLPTGLSLAFILLYGYRMWPAIFLGALFVNLSLGAFFFVALGIAFGNTLEALVGGYLLRRFQFGKSLATYVDVIKLILFGALSATVVSAFIGVVSLYLGNVIEQDAISPTFTAWWMGNAISNLVFAPLVLLWLRQPTLRETQNKSELVAILVSSVITGHLFFSGIIGLEARLFMANFIFPFLIWAAVRFNQKVSVLVVAVFSSVAVINASLGMGPFGEGSLTENLYLFQAFMGITAVTSMFLASAFEERREIEKRKDDFLSIVSHELKTPITTVKAFVQLGQRNLKKNKGRDNLYLERMEHQLDRLTVLVNDLLDLSRIQRQVFSLEKKVFSLNALVAEVIEEAQINNKDYQILFRGGADKKLHGDRERIGQVIRNLISNAIKYSPKRKKIVITVKSTNGQAMVSVKDNGIGIPEDSKKGIFALFYRAVSDRRIQGLGIGLYFSKHIIREHGGDIWFESKKSEGTTFYFTLPYQKQ